MSVTTTRNNATGEIEARCERWPRLIGTGASMHEARYSLAAMAAEKMIGGHLGECVAVVILDHSDPERVPHNGTPGPTDPNISELVYTLLHEPYREATPRG